MNSMVWNQAQLVPDHPILGLSLPPAAYSWKFALPQLPLKLGENVLLMSGGLYNSATLC